MRQIIKRWAILFTSESLMNRYPLWKYILIFFVVALGFLYTVPNFFGEAPGLQIASNKNALKINLETQAKVETLLKKNKLDYRHIFLENTKHASLKIHFKNTEEQIKARDILQKELNPNLALNDTDYIIAMNLMSNSPSWLSAVGANPMFLGLDLRGGVHFLLQVDMQGAVTKKLDGVMNDARLAMRDKGLMHDGFEKKIAKTSPNPAENKNKLGFDVLINDLNTAQQSKILLEDRFKDFKIELSTQDNKTVLQARLTELALKEIQDNAIKQNIVTLNNRVNELGVAEPIVQQQGADRIIVQLPGVQDTSRAKDIIGRTATLESRLADPDQTFVDAPEKAPAGTDTYSMGDGRWAVFKKQVIFTGDRINTAAASFDERQNPVVSLKLDSIGGRYMRDTTRENIGKPMGIILFEKNKAEVLTVATIQGEFGSDFQITGSLAAPMEIIEERTIGPSLGADNIKKGFYSLVYGFAAIAVFMVIYYAGFGFISVIALAINLLLLVGILSFLQATLTLPGIAAIALALGMAIDSNVLINERVREELRAGMQPQSAIFSGFKHAWDTIFDSNVTTLIAGIALLAFGSGPVRGFAVVHSLGILTSMFSAVLVARAIVNLVYGRRKKLQSVSIGQVWKPAED
jgi:preprotein translocase subunit SecD